MRAQTLHVHPAHLCSFALFRRSFWFAEQFRRRKLTPRSGCRPASCGIAPELFRLRMRGDHESEVTLAVKAANDALRAAKVSPETIDWIIAASETHHAFPSLAAQLHLATGVREACGALDVGGACLGLLHGLAVAKSFVESGQARTVLVVTADVHSRTLTPARVAGEFGGLFGDGASAFLIQREPSDSGEWYYSLRDFFFGCANQLQAAIRVTAESGDRLRVVFDGDALSRAATARLDQCIRELECRSGIARGEVTAFATHQPNPRLVALLAKKAGVALARFPVDCGCPRESRFDHLRRGAACCAAAAARFGKLVARRDFRSFAGARTAVRRQLADSSPDSVVTWCWSYASRLRVTNPVPASCKFRIRGANHTDARRWRL